MPVDMFSKPIHMTKGQSGCRSSNECSQQRSQSDDDDKKTEKDRQRTRWSAKQRDPCTCICQGPGQPVIGWSDFRIAGQQQLSQSGEADDNDGKQQRAGYSSCDGRQIGPRKKLTIRNNLVQRVLRSV